MSRNALFRFPAVRPELPPIEAWSPVLRDAYEKNWFTNFGDLSRRLENALNAGWGDDKTACVATSSGTAAIAAPLIAAGISGPVILPAFTFPATASAIWMSGAEPILVDVRPDTWTMSADSMQHALAATGAKACVVVSPFGIRTDFRDHAAIAAAHDAILVIDSAAGLGVDPIPYHADPHVFEAYSMHATKPFGIGEGGVVFGARSCEASLRSALNFGIPDLLADGPPNWGINGKLSEMHAAVGLAVLDTYSERLAKRRLMAGAYISSLSQYKDSVAFVEDVSSSTWQVFPVLMPDEASATRFVANAAGYGLEIRRYYRPSLSVLSGIGMFEACHVSEDLASRMCCLPVYSNSSSDELASILDIVSGCLERAL